MARILDEMVSPFRRLTIAEEEIVCLCAVIVLNPGGSADAAADARLQWRAA